jgi:HEAT repeat protein
MRQMPLVIALLAGWTLAATGTHLAAQGDPSAGEVPTAKLEEAVKQLAAYDFGGDARPLGAMDELVAATQGQPALRKELAERLAPVLVGDAPRGAKSAVCRQLAVIGTADQVPALAPLLLDGQLSHIARYALERIPDPAAEEALRAALATVQAQLRIGIVNSLGNRQSQSAVTDLARLLGDADPAVACAAASALGKIGPVAAPALEQGLAAELPAAVRRSVADACLRCADAFVAEGRRDLAAALYDRLRQAEIPAACRVAATRGAILARQAEGGPLLVEQLETDDPVLFGLALKLVRYAPSGELTTAASAVLGSLPPEKQIRLVEALADRGDRAAVPAVLRLATEGAAAVRPTAVRALGRLGDATLAPALLEMTADADAELARAAMSGLAVLADPEADGVLLAALDKDDARIRTAAIELLLAARSPGELAAVQATLGTACARMRDREAVARQLAAVVPRADVQAKIALLGSLDDPALKNEAAAAVVSIGSRLAASHPTAVAEAMHKILDASDNQDVRQRFGVSPAIAVGSGLS